MNTRTFNKELLLRVKAEILAHPEHLDMSDWSSGTYEEVKNHTCGTTACISGWAVILSGRNDLSTSEGEVVLGIAEKDWRALFLLVCWPPKFRDAYYDAKTPEARAAATAARIDAFIDEIESEVHA